MTCAAATTDSKKTTPTIAMEEILEVKIELRPGLVSFLLDRELKTWFRFELLNNVGGE